MKRMLNFSRILDKWDEGGELKERADEALLQLVAGANLPLSLVDHPCFKKFCQTLCPRYKPPGRRTLTSRLDAACEQYEEKLKNELLQVNRGNAPNALIVRFRPSTSASLPTALQPAT